MRDKAYFLWLAVQVLEKLPPHKAFAKIHFLQKWLYAHSVRR